MLLLGALCAACEPARILAPTAPSGNDSTRTTPRAAAFTPTLTMDTAWLMVGRRLEVSLGEPGETLPPDARLSVDNDSIARFVRGGGGWGVLELRAPGRLHVRGIAGSITVDRALMVQPSPPPYPERLVQSLTVLGAPRAYEDYSVRLTNLVLRRPLATPTLTLVAFWLDTDDTPTTSVCSGMPADVPPTLSLSVTGELAWPLSPAVPAANVFARVRMLLRDANNRLWSSSAEVTTESTSTPISYGVAGWGCQ
jgi:hypothetical protein